MRHTDSVLRHHRVGSPKRLPLALVLLACSVSALICPDTADALDRWFIWTSGNIDPPSDLMTQRTHRTIWGTLPTPPVEGEVAIDQYEMFDGDVVPLSVYPSDGTPATEEEMFWTCALLDLSFECSSGALTARAAHVAIFTGRLLDLSIAERDAAKGTTPSLPPKILVTVVAIRQSNESAVEPDSFGEIKAMLR